MAMTVGIPRAMLYHRYRVLWETFFRELGMEIRLSGETSRETLERGSALSIDETCLSAKIWFGHVDELIGECDTVFVPRMASFGRYRYMCTRFEALPDLTRNVFRTSGQHFCDCNIDVLAHQKEEDAYIALGTSLGAAPKAAKKACRTALREYERSLKEEAKAEEARYRQDGLKVIIAAHSYVYNDAWIGRPVTAFLEKNGITPLMADRVDRGAALKRSAEVSRTCKWEINREILGSIAMHRDMVNGVVLMSAFPCGPDSMVNDMIQRKFPGLPMLNLTLDGQSGTAGQETRLESFADILRFKEGLL